MTLELDDALFCCVYLVSKQTELDHEMLMDFRTEKRWHIKKQKNS